MKALRELSNKSFVKMANFKLPVRKLLKDPKVKPYFTLTLNDGKVWRTIQVDKYYLRKNFGFDFDYIPGRIYFNITIDDSNEVFLMTSLNRCNDVFQYMHYKYDLKNPTEGSGYFNPTEFGEMVAKLKGELAEEVCLLTNSRNDPFINDKREFVEFLDRYGY